MRAGARLHPSIPAIVLFIWWVVATVVFPDRMLNADGDMLRHIRHGDYMLAHGGLIHADPFSYTRGGDAFVGFEYGSQLIYALVHRIAGLAGVAIFAGLLIGASYALLTRFLLSRGADPLLTYLVSVGAAVLGSVHWSARPHLFTLVGVMVVLHLLEPGPAPHTAPVRHPVLRPALLTALLFAVWANLHGGFVFGLVLFGIYFAGSVGELLVARRTGGDVEPWRVQALRYLALGFAGLAGTFATPNGVALHAHIIKFFGERFLMDNTQEFLSPDFHSLVGKLLLLALLGIVTVFALTPPRPDLRRLFLVLALVYFALDARRNIQLFGATVFPILALQFDPLWRRVARWRIREVFERDAKLGRTLPYAALLALAFSVVAAGRGEVAGVRVVPNALDPVEFPIAVVKRARAANVDGRIFHDFVWGGYMLYAWPEQKVFIDGGTDFYGPALLRSYMDAASLRPGWRDSLVKWNIEYALIAPTTTFAHELLRQPGWRIRDCDETAVLLERRGDDVVPDPDASLDGCSARTTTP